MLRVDLGKTRKRQKRASNVCGLILDRQSMKDSQIFPSNAPLSPGSNDSPANATTNQSLLLDHYSPFAACSRSRAFGKEERKVLSCTGADAAARQGNPRYDSASDRSAVVRQREAQDKSRSCGSQSAHQGRINRRLAPPRSPLRSIVSKLLSGGRDAAT
jgi:hypothetical protein